MLERLPIDEVHDELRNAWASRRNFILRAPTGSGKSTRVPRYLLEWQGFPENKIIYVLQPRRMAARLLARRVASELGERTGETAGYRIRFESSCGKDTRLVYVTEGLLLRRLASGDRLDDVGAILFDEFHERHLEGDVALGLAVERQLEGWEGRIGVFSATLETSSLAGYLPDSTVLESEGRQFPVDVQYLSTSARVPAWEKAAQAFRAAVSGGLPADILVFMPGKYEINRTVRAIEETREARDWDVFPLHGELSTDAQDRAIGTSARPRVIVSTNIAETSLTLPGIRTIIDSGLVRMPDFDPRRGVNTLLTEKISRASADQRAGRAGRLAPGNCIRLWSESEHVHRLAFTAPEIERLDLSETRLQLLAMERDTDFAWFQEPGPEAWQHAGELLEDLGASSDGKITSVGREMVRYPLHPRFSRLLIAAQERSCTDLVLAAIAISEAREMILPLNDKRKAREREEWWSPAEGVSDQLKGVLAWQKALDAGLSMDFCREWGIHAQSARQATRVFQQLKRLSGKDDPNPQPSPENFARCMLAGYMDQLARRKDRGTLRCELVHGRRGELSRNSIVDSPMFVATDVEEREIGGNATLFLASATAIKESWLKEEHPDDFSAGGVERMDPDRRRVIRVEQSRFRDLVLEEKESGEPDPHKAAQLLAEQVVAKGWVLKKWDSKAENWVRRVNVLAQHFPEWEIKPMLEEDRVLLIEQICEGASAYKEIKDRPVMPVLHSWLPQSMLPLVDEYVPERIQFSEKGSAKLRYEEDGTVVLAARIQQLFNVKGEKLNICQGRCSLRIELLAPNGRPVQITDDLDSFWTGQYPQIRKELFGRYPKHEWR
ncbi:MAG: ATP-dependent helicase HrpB [Puniceicoccaceae bacterium]